MVDQTIPEHRTAEGPADERCHHRLSQRRTPLSPNPMCEKFWTLPSISPHRAPDWHLHDCGDHIRGHAACCTANDAGNCRDKVEFIRPSTTLADLLRPPLVANPFSTMRASLRR